MRNTDQGQRTQNQASAANPNSTGNDAVALHYALLTRLAALDVELAKNATQAGIAVDLSFPKETIGFASVATSLKQDHPRKK